jgi:aryl carrier-like protein
MKTGQVKLRGQRVELGEVEEAVLKTPGLHAVSSTVIDGILIVFGLLGDDELSEGAVLRVCRQWLPSFMVPGDVVLLKTFPRLVSGKVDKKMLDQLYSERKAKLGTESLTGGDDAWDGTQLAIREVLSSLSDIPKERIAVSSTIYQLGIDSLAAVHVASRLRQQGLEVTVGDVLEVSQTLS